MPRLNLTYGVDAKAGLKALGITAAFRPEEADFTQMTRERAPVYVERVLHQAVLKLDERGTEAAAATVVQLPPTSAAPRVSFRMTIDHPFFFALHGAAPDQLLFIGAVQRL